MILQLIDKLVIVGILIIPYYGDLEYINAPQAGRRLKACSLPDPDPGPDQGGKTLSHLLFPRPGHRPEAIRRPAGPDGARRPDQKGSEDS